MEKTRQRGRFAPLDSLGSAEVELVRADSMLVFVVSRSTFFLRRLAADAHLEEVESLIDFMDTKESSVGRLWGRMVIFVREEA